MTMWRSLSHVEGCRVAFYLVHSMMATEADHARTDCELARGFGPPLKACRAGEYYLSWGPW